MGYYQGSQGVVVSGGSSCGSGGSVTFRNGTMFIGRRTNVTTTKYAGVSLATAQEKNGTYLMKPGYAVDYTYSSTAGFTYYKEFLVPDYEGSVVDYSYSQIGGSNLYELVKTETSVSSWKMNNGAVKL